MFLEYVPMIGSAIGTAGPCPPETGQTIITPTCAKYSKIQGTVAVQKRGEISYSPALVMEGITEKVKFKLRLECGIHQDHQVEQGF